MRAGAHTPAAVEGALSAYRSVSRDCEETLEGPRSHGRLSWDCNHVVSLSPHGAGHHDGVRHVGGSVCVVAGWHLLACCGGTRFLPRFERVALPPMAKQFVLAKCCGNSMPHNKPQWEGSRAQGVLTRR